MSVVCRKCGYQFSNLEQLQAGATNADCPKCQSPVNIAEQVAAVAGKDTETDSAPAAKAAPPAKTIGGYEIINEISRGAVGVVYKARDRKQRREVALKLLLAGVHASAEQIVRFDKEARAASQLRHPSIVPIYDVGSEGGNRFFTMEFVEGKSLDLLISQKKLSTRRSLEIAAVAADALAYAHQKGIVHRDIKPANILIDQFGLPRITDFGLAKELDADTKFTRTGATIGTPLYMAPEQARGDNEHVDARTDIYSLGAVLYEMLAGAAPFSGQSAMSILVKVMNDDPQPICKINPRLHRDIQTIVAKAMEKDPDHRYKTMAEFADDIRRYLAGEAIAAKPAHIGRRVTGTFRRFRAPITVGLAITLILSSLSAIVIGYLYIQREKTRRQAEQAERELMLSTADQKPEWVTQFIDNFSGMTRRPAWIISGGDWHLDNGALAADVPDEGTAELDQVFYGNVDIEFSFAAISNDFRVNCFIGESLNRGHVFRISRSPEPMLSLMRMGSILAEVQAPELKTRTVYRVKIRRVGPSISCTVSSQDTSWTLPYEDPELLAAFTQIRFGLQTRNSQLRFGDVVVKTQEFEAEKLSKLQFIDHYLLRRGQLEKARDEYIGVIAQHAGKPIAVLAEFHLGLVQEALSHDSAQLSTDALLHYQNVEQQKALLSAEQLPLVALNPQRIFFTLADTGGYRAAAAHLSQYCGAGGEFDAGTVWRFSAILSRCSADLAYEPALAIMERARFSGDNKTLGDCWRQSGPHIRHTFAKCVGEIAMGFAEQARFEELKRAYTAVPDPAALPAFDAAASKAMASDQTPAALDLLLFCTSNGIQSETLEATALRIAQQYCDAKQYTRLTNVHIAYPTRALAPYFDKGIAALCEAGDLSTATNMLIEACRRFPDDKGQFAQSLDLLMNLCLEKGNFDALRTAYSSYGDTKFADKLIIASHGLMDANQLDASFDMLTYISRNIPERRAELNSLASDLVTRLSSSGQTQEASELLTQYPSKQMSKPLVSMLRDATKKNQPQLIEQLMTHALAKYTDDEQLDKATRNVTKSLISAKEYDLVLKIYSEAATACSDKDMAALIVFRGGELLMASGAYPQAVAAFNTGIAIPPANARLSSAALTKIAVLYYHLAEPEKALRTWAEIAAKFHDQPEAKIATFVLGQMPLREFRTWQSANTSLVPNDEADFYVAIQSAIAGNYQASQEILQKIIYENKDRNPWFAPIAQALYSSLAERNKNFDRPIPRAPVLKYVPEGVKR